MLLLLLLLLLPFVSPVFSDVITPSFSPLISPAFPPHLSPKLSKEYTITKPPISHSFGNNNAKVNQTQFGIDHYETNPQKHFPPSSSYDATIAPASSSSNKGIENLSSEIKNHTDVYNNDNGNEEPLSQPPSFIVDEDSAVMKKEGLKRVMDFNYKAEDEIEGFGVEEERRYWNENKKDGVVSGVLVGVCVVGLGGFVYKVRMNRKKSNYYHPLSKRSISI